MTSSESDTERAALTRCRWQRAVLVALIVLALACAGLNSTLDRSHREAAAVRTGFMALRGGVGATELEVNALIKGAFRSGMTRDEVIAKLDAMFGCYQLYPLDRRTGEPDEDWDYVIFPGTDCICDKFKAQDSDCSSMGYSFDFHGDMLVEVSWFSS